MGFMRSHSCGCKWGKAAHEKQRVLGAAGIEDHAEHGFCGAGAGVTKVALLEDVHVDAVIEAGRGGEGSLPRDAMTAARGRHESALARDEGVAAIRAEDESAG